MNKRFHVLDGFRGIFALLVALYHFKPGPGHLSEFSLISHGWLFVDFFFVLSGFVIFYNYSKISEFKEQKSFLIKRFLRLYPLHFCILIVFLLFEISKLLLYDIGLFNKLPFQEQTITSFIANIFLVQAYGLPIEQLEHLSWNASSWSISAEFFSYIIFCFTIVYINKLNLNYRVAVHLLISLVAISLIYISNDNNLTLKLGAHFGILRCLYSFYLGCIACDLYVVVFAKKIELEKSVHSNKTLFTILECVSLAIALVAICYLPLSLTYVIPILFFFCILIFAFEKGILSKIMDNKVLRKIGTLSYSIYMINELMQIVFDIVLLRVFKIKNPFLYDFMAISYLISIIIVSNFTYKYFEIHGKKILERMIYRKRNNSLLRVQDKVDTNIIKI